MNELTVTLRVLKDILEKKMHSLTGILGICQNQETILMSPPSAERTYFFTQSNANKQDFIDEVKEYDKVFQSFFDTIKADIEEKAKADKDSNKPEILALQALINQVLELDVAIRAQEVKNNTLLPPAPLHSRPHTPGYRRQALSELNKHKNL